MTTYIHGAHVQCVEYVVLKSCEPPASWQNLQVTACKQNEGCMQRMRLFHLKIFSATSEALYQVGLNALEMKQTCFPRHQNGETFVCFGIQTQSDTN